MQERPKRILLFRTDRLGDVVLTSPAATILHRHFPGTHVTVMARTYTEEILRLHCHVDEVLSYEPQGRHRGRSGLRELVHLLRQGRYDATIFFYPRPRLALAAWLARIPLRIGTRYKWYSALFNCRLPQRRKHGGRHELEYNLELLRPLVGEVPQKAPFAFEIPAGLRTWRREWLQQHGIASDYAILHTGSGGSAPNLNAAQYRLVASTLLEHSPLQLLLTGTAAEHADTEALRIALASDRVQNVAGATTPARLAALLEDARLFVSSSTGPLHLANAFGVPVVAFYCPSPPCSPRRWGPYGQLEWVRTPDVIPCGHCNPQRCVHGNCLETLTTEDLHELVLQRLASLGGASAP